MVGEQTNSPGSSISPWDRLSEWMVAANFSLRSSGVVISSSKVFGTSFGYIRQLHLTAVKEFSINIEILDGEK